MSSIFVHSNLCVFLPNLNTVKTVEKVFEHNIMNFEKKHITSALLIDFSNVFDCIVHTLLLDKLYHYSIRGKELNLFSSYVNNRKQMVI